MSNFNVIHFLAGAANDNVSDIYLKLNKSPIIRKNSIMQQTNLPVLTQEDIDSVVNTLMPDNFKPGVREMHDFDFSYEIPNVSRFRVNFCREMGKISFIIRTIPYVVPSFNTLNLPPSIENFTKLNNGIVLITGPTGSGKSTTIASLLDYINKTSQKHIITLEDPVEFIYTNNKSVFTQRQLGIDTTSFPNGIKYALRQDPDVILIGEMRDRETISSALKAAETGHLVFSTLHTIDAVQTINRIINVFEPHERDSIKNQIANVLKGTVSQKLLKKTNNGGMVPAVEILSITPAVKSYIIKEELESIYDLIKTGNFNDMITMNMSLYRLVKANLITTEDAIAASNAPNELEQLLKGAFHGSRSF